MNRTMAIVFASGLLVAVMAGCSAPAPEQTASGEQPAVTDPVQLPEQVRKAVEIARAIEADPDRSEAILEEAVMTADEYEALLYDIAADPELSRLYNQAMAD